MNNAKNIPYFMWQILMSVLLVQMAALKPAQTLTEVLTVVVNLGFPLAMTENRVKKVLSLFFFFFYFFFLNECVC